MPAPASSLAGWQATPFAGGGLTYDVYAKAPVAGGPGVVVIPEVPGISPEVLAFADHLVAAGFSVVIPSLFGTPGKPVSLPYALATITRLCIATEMKAFGTATDRPVSLFLRALAVDLHSRTPGPGVGVGVGVVGMCFTGGFALATAVDPSVSAAVMSQPSIPFSLGAARRRDLGLSPGETATVTGRTLDGLCLMGLKFSNDKALSQERFDAYARTPFGDAVQLIVLRQLPRQPRRLQAHRALRADRGGARGPGQLRVRRPRPGRGVPDGAALRLIGSRRPPCSPRAPPTAD